MKIGNKQLFNSGVYKNKLGFKKEVKVTFRGSR